jgi:HAD superfamily hydrolase (TIGR01549 family)
LSIRAVTFDFWDTIVADDTDEPKRADKGLPTKAEERVHSFVSEVRAHHPGLDEPTVRAALDTANERFRQSWKGAHRTPSVADRLFVGFQALGIDRTPGFDALVATWENMEVEIPPDLAPGIGDCLAALAGKVRIGIISDAIVTPGVGLRQILRDYKLAHYFDDFVFSDEAGAAKPAARVFELATGALGVSADELVHVGDREANDIEGPRLFGAHSILYTGTIDRLGPGQVSKADRVVSHHRDLPAAVAAISAELG